jgi:hypothetical protein
MAKPIFLRGRSAGLSFYGMVQTIVVFVNVEFGTCEANHIWSFVIRVGISECFRHLGF